MCDVLHVTTDMCVSRVGGWVSTAATRSIRDKSVTGLAGGSRVAATANTRARLPAVGHTRPVPPARRPRTGTRRAAWRGEAEPHRTCERSLCFQRTFQFHRTSHPRFSFQNTIAHDTRTATTYTNTHDSRRTTLPNCENTLGDVNRWTARDAQSCTWAHAHVLIVQVFGSSSSLHGDAREGPWPQPRRQPRPACEPQPCRPPRRARRSGASTHAPARHGP